MYHLLSGVSIIMPTTYFLDHIMITRYEMYISTFQVCCFLKIPCLHPPYFYLGYSVSYSKAVSNNLSSRGVSALVPFHPDDPLNENGPLLLNINTDKSYEIEK